jgi:hypothetical protein
MRTTGPTAGPPHTFTHLVEADGYATSSGFVFFSGSNPTDPLVPCQRGDVRPHLLRDRVVLDCFAEVCRHFMNGSGAELLGGCHFLQMSWTLHPRRLRGRCPEPREGRDSRCFGAMATWTGECCSGLFVGWLLFSTFYLCLQGLMTSSERNEEAGENSPASFLALMCQRFRIISTSLR